MHHVRAARIFLFAAVLWMADGTPSLAMQPPPPPLDARTLAALAATADAVALVRVTDVRVIQIPGASDDGPRRVVEATAEVERCLSVAPCGPVVRIREEAWDDPSKSVVPEDAPISSMVAGPRPYHADYHVGDRLLALLEKTGQPDLYRPLGSGTYDRHLGVFVLGEAGVRPFFFSLAPDLAAHADSETAFLDFIAKNLGLPKKESGSRTTGRLPADRGRQRFGGEASYPPR